MHKQSYRNPKNLISKWINRSLHNHSLIRSFIQSVRMSASQLKSITCSINQSFNPPINLLISLSFCQSINKSIFQSVSQLGCYFRISYYNVWITNVLAKNINLNIVVKIIIIWNSNNNVLSLLQECLLLTSIKLQSFHHISLNDIHLTHPHL